MARLTQVHRAATGNGRCEGGWVWWAGLGLNVCISKQCWRKPCSEGAFGCRRKNRLNPERVESA